MNLKLCFLLLLSLASVAVSQEEQPEATPQTSTSQSPPEPPSTPPSTTVDPPPTPTTSRSTTPTTTPTTSRPTTTPTTTRTTSRPTTTAATTPRTTSPTTPTTRPSTTTLPPVAPPPPPFPQNVGNWSVQDKGLKGPCIIITGALQLHVNRTNATELVVDVPTTSENVHVNGTCGSDEQELVIDWWSIPQANSSPERNNVVTLKFAKAENEQYGLVSIKYQYTHEKHAMIVGPFFLTKLKHSFSCQSNQRVQQEGESAYILTEKLQFEAFRLDDVVAGGFSPADECKADSHTSTGVVLGIAVGIGLLITAVVALAIYLFKRCRRGGYQNLAAQT